MRLNYYRPSVVAGGTGAFVTDLSTRTKSGLRGEYASGPVGAIDKQFDVIVT